MTIGIIEDLVARVERLEKQLADGGLEGYVDQTKSPLGPKIHCRAVRRLVSEKDERAAIKGRKHYLSISALKEELHRGSSPGISSGPSSKEDDDFYRDLMKEVRGE